MGSNVTFRRGGWRSTGRRVLSILVAALVAIGLAACGTGPGGGSGEVKDAGAPLKLGLSMPALDTPFFSVLIKEATAAAQAAGGTVVQTTNANRDSGQQVTDIRNLVTAGANAIIAGIADRKAIQPALDYAASRDVPSSSSTTSHRRPDRTQWSRRTTTGMGAQAAEKLAEPSPTGREGPRHHRRSRDEQRPRPRQPVSTRPSGQVPEHRRSSRRPPSGSGPTSRQRDDNAVLSQNPDLAGIYLATDTLYPDPVSAALDRSWTPGPGRDSPATSPIVAIDGGVGALKAIRAGDPRRHRLPAGERLRRRRRGIPARGPGGQDPGRRPDRATTARLSTTRATSSTSYRPRS